MQAAVCRRALTTAKRAFLRKEAQKRFDQTCLALPRSDKTKHVGRIFPLDVGGTLSFSPEVWCKEFTDYYIDLFRDRDNTIDKQTNRLQDLRRQAGSDTHIVVPRYIVLEVLAKGRSKSGSAAGADGVSWSAIPALPLSCIDLLANMFEGRINLATNLSSRIQSWADVLVTLIPKTTEPKLVKEWRPIALCAVVQKICVGVLIKLIDMFRAPVDPCQYGFTAGRQPMEISEAIRMTASKLADWDLGGVFLKCDVSRAFDNIRHQHVLDALTKQDCPARLCHGVMLELLDCNVNIVFQGAQIDPIAMEEGGRQGGADTPALWIRVLDLGISRAKDRWRDESLGLCLPGADGGPQEYLFDCLAWADDIILGPPT